MPYLLDGNNLIGRPSPSEEDRSRLIAEVADRLRRTRARAVLVFDGGGRRQTSLGPLTIRQGMAASADDDISRLVSDSKSPREMVVVTADRELARRVRDAGARVLTPADFWRAFGGPASPAEKGESAIDVEDWTRYFEDERNRER